jgi:pyrimidine-nucleoside phosphorylase
MEFLPAEFIKQRRRGEAHSRSEIDQFIHGFVQDQIPDYQMSAWLMATCFQPLSQEQTGWLTQAMSRSGRQLKFRSPIGLSVDKHSTGGVGDKTSMIVAPIVAAAGVHVPMMAGRGLGHTGGTLDKLESIAGMNVRWDLEHFQKQVETIGAAIIGQTEEICPADRKMYSLRDVTGTIDSLPLICASIMSKKIAEGCEALVLDVKFGSGAFMKTLDEAKTLARALTDIGRAAGLKVASCLTNMAQPLGRFVGNSLEITECLEILRQQKIIRPGKTTQDTEALSVELAAQMLFLAERVNSLESARDLVKNLLSSGKAYSKFEEIVRAQGGDLGKDMSVAKFEQMVTASASGFVHFKDIEKMGLGCVVLGAGRKKSSDQIDLTAGLEIFVSEGDAVKAGDPLFRACGMDRQKVEDAKPFFDLCVGVVDEPTTSLPLIA